MKGRGRIGRLLVGMLLILAVCRSMSATNLLPKGAESQTMSAMGQTKGAESQTMGATNLLPNGSFEDYSCSVFGCSLPDWSLPLGSGVINGDDKIDGEVSLQISATSIHATLDNEVRLSDDNYTPGTSFVITMYYQILSLPDKERLSLDCYWEPEPGGDADEMKAHDADSLQRVLADSVPDGWKKVEVSTTKPTGSAKLRVRIVIPKKGKVLLDAFSVTEEKHAPQGDPYIHVSPLKLSAVTTTIGNTVNFATVHIEQGNLTGPTTFELSGYNADQFQLSALSLPADQSSIDLIVTYAPTQAGTHTALLNIDNLKHTTLFRAINLQGTCTDPSIEPSIEVNPKELLHFEAVEGKEMRDTFQVISTNCTDYVYLRVEHIKGAAFTIDGTMVGKNATSNIVVRFAPKEPGEYESVVTVYSAGMTSQTVSLKGIGIKRDEGHIDWKTRFEWDESKPLKLLNETFDQVAHNQTIVLDGWQNVAAVDQRPWWGFDESVTSPKRGTGKYAKATAYQYGKDSTGTWEMFLVTPALDYKNAEGKIFAFSVMGEYLPDDEPETALEVYYVDATGEKAYFQDMTESFVFPTTSVDNGVWVTYFLNLAPYEETVADVFHIAFRYIGPNGGAGAVTYYIDDVSWGRADLPEIRFKPTYLVDSTSYVGEEKVLGEIEVEGRNLTNEIMLGVAGPNYNRFNLSTGTLPVDGGKFYVSFLGQESGVHEAYIVLSSKGAAEVYIPMSVLCHDPMGIEAVMGEGLQVTGKKILNGHLYILKNGKIFTIMGSLVK